MRTKTVPSVRHAFGIAAIGALAALAGADRASAQQIANVQQDRAAHLAAKCDHIKDHAEAAGCYTRESIKFDQARGAAADRRAAAADQRAAAADQRAAAADQRGAAAQQTIASEQALRPCLLFLKTKKDGGFVFDRAITRENACAYARDLGMKEPG
jgi:hypothetical protein